MGMLQHLLDMVSNRDEAVDLPAAVIALAGNPFRANAGRDDWPVLFLTCKDEHRGAAHAEWLAFHAFLSDLAAQLSSLPNEHRDDLLDEFASAMQQELGVPLAHVVLILNARLAAFEANFRGQQADSDIAWKHVHGRASAFIKMAAMSGVCEINQPTLLEKMFPDHQAQAIWRRLNDRAFKYHLVLVTTYGTHAYPRVKMNALKDAARRVEAACKESGK